VSDSTREINEKSESETGYAWKEELEELKEPDSQEVTVVETTNNRAAFSCRGKRIVVTKLPDKFSLQVFEDAAGKPLSPATTIKAFVDLLERPKYQFVKKAVGSYELLNAFVVKMQETFPEEVQPAKPEVEVGSESIITNEIDPEWIKSHLSRSIAFLLNPNIESFLITHLQRHVICSYLTAKAIMSSQVTVGIPPIRNFGDGLSDWVEERGQEQLLLDKKYGGGGGTLLKYLEKVGVRVFAPSRITKSFLERFASSLNHGTFFVEEIRVLYPSPALVKQEQTLDSEIATALKQAIERGKIVLSVCEKDEEGNIQPINIVSDARWVTIATSALDIEDVAMISRMTRLSLPQFVGEHATIVKKLYANVGIGTEEIEKRREQMNEQAFLGEDDIRAIYQTIFCLNHGLFDGDEEVKKTMPDPNCLLPILDFEIPEQYRLELYKAWLKVLAQHNLDSTYKYSYEKSGQDETGTVKINKVSFTLPDIVTQIDGAQGLDQLEGVLIALNAIGLEVKNEGLVRLYLDGIRRCRASASLHQLLRQYKIVKVGEKQSRMVLVNEDDYKEGLEVIQLQGRLKERTAIDVRRAIIEAFLEGKSGATLAEIADELNARLGETHTTEAYRPLINTMVKEKQLECTGEGTRGSPYIYVLGGGSTKAEEKTRGEKLGICEVCGKERYGAILDVNGRLSFRCGEHGGGTGWWVSTRPIQGEKRN